MANQPISEKDLVRDAANAAFSEGVRKAFALFLDNLSTAGGDDQEKAEGGQRLETALATYKTGHGIILEVANRLFPE